MPVVMTLDLNMTVGQLVAERSGRARIFERLGIDYCCGGRVPLARACTAKGLDAESVLRELEACDRQAGATATDEWLPSSMAELADYIVATHHAFLRRELPRLTALAGKVADAHGERRPELRELRDVLSALREELEAHSEEEERVVFPRIKRMEADAGRSRLAPDDVSGMIRDLEREHEGAGASLARMRDLTGGYAQPADACNTYRALLGGLAELELDMHQHVHRENNILFPGVLAAAARSGLTRT
jgi:regulator of cell morphogenesis and NO signaling